MRTPFPRLAAVLLIAGSTAGAAGAPFTPGNVVVFRVGDGTAALVGGGNAASLDEYTPAGVRVQSVALPTTGSGAQRALVTSGTSTTDGLISRSADGSCLLVPGYGRDLNTGTGNVAGSGTLDGGLPIPRVVGIVDAAATIDTTTALLDADKLGNMRGATSTDCHDLWVSGAAATGQSGGGVRYAVAGATTSTDLTGAPVVDTRAVAIQGDQLYVSGPARSVSTVGSGLPKGGAQAVTLLPGLPASTQPYQFAFARLSAASPGFDTVYFVNENGINKYALGAGTWTARGRIGNGADSYRALTILVDGANVTILAVRKAAELVSALDTSGAGGTLTAPVNLLASAGTNIAFRGLAPTPQFTVTPKAGEHGTISPATPVVATPLAPLSFTVTPEAGYNAVVAGTCGGSIVGNTFTTDPVRATCTAEVIFTKVLTYTVTPSAGPGGSITPASTQTLTAGTRGTFEVVAAHGFGVTVAGTCGGTLDATTYTTLPVTTDCTVEASFPPLPRYSVSTTVRGNGSVTPATPQVVIAGDTAAITLVPASGYNVAVRGTCGGHFEGDTYVTAPAAADCSVDVVFAQKLVLFVGNSYTFGRVDPVMSYNAANVTDLTYGMWLANPVGTNDDEPHPWGGIPGLFKRMTQSAGLDWDVSISARNAASLRGQYLNSNPAGWDLRGNVASQRFDTIVLQDLSDEPLPANRGANANLAYFNAYVDKLEAWAHQGAAESYTETQLFGGTTAACRAATGASANACDTARVIAPANRNARAAASVYLYQTWARPDMIGPNGSNASGLFYSAAEGLEAMTRDLHDAYFGRAAANGNIEDVAPVGDAFLRAVTEGVAMRDPYVPEAGKVDLWHTDFFHPSKYGSYLSAAVHFAMLTGINPLTLGADDAAAADLGIAPVTAVQLQRVAQLVVNPDTVAPTSSASRSVAPNAAGWNREEVTITLAATDSGGAGLDTVHYTLSGAQAGAGTLASGGTVTIGAEGVTDLVFFAVDRAGNAEAPRTLRISIDRVPPTIAGMPARCSIWPPNHAMVVVGTVSAADAGSGVASFAVNAAGAGAAAGDTTVTGTGVAPRTVSVRAEKDRTYTITASATDLAGNTAAATATCVVPHDQAGGS